MVQADENWANEQSPANASDEVMYVDVDGYEGPLDLLLELARRQKLDLAHVSVLALAEQYLAFIETVREKRIEIAADYLVMAAWLTYLKSRLMVPQVSSDDEPSGEMMAAMLQFRLKRLDAMRAAGAKLLKQPRLGLQLFARGDPEPIVVKKNQLLEADLYALLKAYAVQRERTSIRDYTPPKRTVWALQDARDILQRMIGEAADWAPMDTYLAQYLGTPTERATVIASSFSASLELARQGQIELRQTVAFGPLMMRRGQGQNQGQVEAQTNQSEGGLPLAKVGNARRGG